MTNIDSFDWTNWVPSEKATIVFIRTEEAGEKGLYLIEKKRGLGASKINAPGETVSKVENSVNFFSK